MKKLSHLLFISTVSLITIGGVSCNNNKLYDINATEKEEDQALAENENSIFSGNLSAELIEDESDFACYPYHELNFYKDGKLLPYDDEYDFTQDDFLYIRSIKLFLPWDPKFHDGLSKEGLEKCIIYLREAPFKDSVIVDGINVTESLNEAYYNAKGEMDDWNWNDPKRYYGRTVFTNSRKDKNLYVYRNSNGALTIG